MDNPALDFPPVRRHADLTGPVFDDDVEEYVPTSSKKFFETLEAIRNSTSMVYVDLGHAHRLDAFEIAEMTESCIQHIDASDEEIVWRLPLAVVHDVWKAALKISRIGDVTLYPDEEDEAYRMLVVSPSLEKAIVARLPDPATASPTPERVPTVRTLEFPSSRASRGTQQ